MNRDDDIQEKIGNSKLEFPRVTLEMIESKIDYTTYTTLPSGKSIVCEITLENGFTVRGDSAVVSVENFNEEIGKEVAFRKAKDKIGDLLAYHLQEELYQNSN